MGAASRFPRKKTNTKKPKIAYRTKISFDILTSYFELKNESQKYNSAKTATIRTVRMLALSTLGIEIKFSVIAIIPARLAPLLSLITTTFPKLKIKTLSQNSLKVPQNLNFLI